jgi:hypothetical protein
MNESGQFVIQHSTDKSGKPVDPVLHLVNEALLTDTSVASPALTIAILSSQCLVWCKFSSFRRVRAGMRVARRMFKRAFEQGAASEEARHTLFFMLSL